jgi:hypothetical protein
MSNRKFQDGEIVKDIITGYTGVVVGYAEYFTGCKHYGLFNRRLTKEGKMKDDNWEWFDESRLVSTGKKITISKPVDEPSGPMPTPPQCN